MRYENLRDDESIEEFTERMETLVAATKVLWKKYPYHPPRDSGYWLDMFKEGAKYQLEQDNQDIKLLKEELEYLKRNKL